MRTLYPLEWVKEVQNEEHRETLGFKTPKFTLNKLN